MATVIAGSASSAAPSRDPESADALKNVVRHLPVPGGRGF